MLPRIIFGFISSCFIWTMALLIASDEPWTSDLIIIFNSSETLSLNADSWVAKVNGFLLTLLSCILESEKVFASFSLFKIIKSSRDRDAKFIQSISLGD